MRIGYTTGVFDLFHIGHLNILKRASAECDRLIVGVTTDELSLKRKGKTPIIPFSERLEIVRCIRYVDAVRAQTSFDKMLAWRDVGFHVMFVGDDWKGTQEWNRLEKQFAEIGVDIVYYPYTKGTSSSLLRRVLTGIENGIVSK